MKRFLTVAMGTVLLLACAPKKHVEEVLVEGEGLRVTRKDFENYLSRLPSLAREQYSEEKLLDFYVRGELAYLEALRLGLDRDPAVRESIDRAVKQLLQNEYTRREIKGKMGIPDEQVLAYYEAHREEFRAPTRRKCWHILTRTREDAQRAREAILAGEDFRDVATRYSLDEQTRHEGGRIGIFSREDAPPFLKARPQLLDTLFSLAPGHVSEVVETDMGFHILRATPAKQGIYLPVDSVATIIRERLLVPDSLVRAYYDEHPHLFTGEDRAQIRLIEVPTRAEAERLRERILAGEDMASLAAQGVDARLAARGGLADWITRGRSRAGIPPEVEAAVWDVPEGGMGPVVKTARGFAVFRVERRQYAGLQPFEEVRDRIRRQLLVQAREQATERAFQDLKARYKLRYHEKVGRPARRAPEGAGAAIAAEESLFAQASREPDPRTKLELYRRILADYPQGARADESQFMVGFVYLDMLHDTAAAVEALRELLTRFPQSEWVDDAQGLLGLLQGQGSGREGVKSPTAGEPTS